MATKKNLDIAKKNKKDEFYTQISDIENELKHYVNHFEGKVIFLNCDDPDWSNFWKYFKLNFEKLKLKKLISTHFSKVRKSFKQECFLKNGKLKIVQTDLNQNGDFRSDECIELLKESDIVVTNPPFSLFRDYVSQLIEYDKKFVIIGHQNAISYKEIFPLFKENKIWLGYGFKGGAAHFRSSDYQDYATAGNHKDGMIRVSGVHWFTNLDIKKRHDEIFLFKDYNKEEYPHYDNFDAININKTKDIPNDYFKVMGVPITFMDKYSPDQFELIGLMASTTIDEYNKGYPFVKGEKKYARILIKRKV